MTGIATRGGAAPGGRDLVVLLHGLSRTHRSLRRLAAHLQDAGFDTVVWDYPSRRYAVAELIEMFRRYLRTLEGRRTRVHFVGHSLGAIILRGTLSEPQSFPVGRVVMLGPPNRGAALVDRLRRFTALARIYGKPSAELGTGSRLLRNLGRPMAEVGVIAGCRRFHPCNPTSWLNLVFNPLAETDGTVEIENTRLEGMKDFLVVPANHSFLMDHPDAIRQTANFLRHGRFERAERGQAARGTSPAARAT